MTTKDYAYCRSCKYCSRDYESVASQAYCDYLDHTGHARSVICPPGVGCICYERRERRKPKKWSLPKRPKDQKRIRKRGGKINGKIATKLYGEGANDCQIAAACGVTRGAIRQWRMKNGLAPNAGRGEQAKDKVC